MATSINKVTLIGNMTRDPDVRDLGNGDRVASFNLATNESWTDKASGEKRERTEFHNVVVFNQGLVGIVAEYFRKGMRVYLEGTLQTRRYTDRDGNERQTTEIVLPRQRGEMMMLDRQGQAQAQVAEPAEAPAAAATPAPEDPVDEDDGIPF